MSEKVGSSVIKPLGKIVVPGAPQMVSGKIGSGIIHNLVARVAGAATQLAVVPGNLACLVRRELSDSGIASRIIVYISVVGLRSPRLERRLVVKASRAHAGLPRSIQQQNFWLRMGNCLRILSVELLREASFNTVGVIPNDVL